jgi:3-hydroxyisobutyrate dehydrogenase-like beta-hydroxyacid dehydrogenase
MRKPREPTRTRPPAPIGLIGLGLVGGALAGRLRQAGFCILGFDVDAGRRRALAALGGQVVESAAQVFAACDRVLLSLPNSNVVESVLREAAPQLRRGLRIIDTTTGEPDATAQIGKKLGRRDVRYLDATIVGSSAQVSAGDVLVLAGGKRADYMAARDVFAAFAKQSFHVGPCGSGARMKLVVNLVLGLNRAVLAEGLVFARRVGVSPELALEILKAGVAYSRVMDTKGAKMLARDFAPQAKLAQHLKDVRLILQLGLRRGAKLPFSKIHERLLTALANQGFADADNSAIIEAFK